jgi:hypothetical protein
MQIRFKWTMWRLLKHLCFKTFLMVSKEPNLVLVYFSNQGSKHLQLCMNATPKVGVQLGVIRLHPLQSPPFMRVCFTRKHTLGLMGLCISLLVMNPMLRLQHWGSRINFHEWHGLWSMLECWLNIFYLRSQHRLGGLPNNLN